MKPVLTPLEPWIARRIGRSKLTRQDLEAWQLARRRESVAPARTKSPFYASHLDSIRPEDIRSLTDLASLPLLDEHALRTHGPDMLCAPQDEVARVVTLQSSGSTGPAKRLFFSDADLELTLGFFEHGMSTFTRPGQRVLILLPGSTPDSTGHLLARALERLGAEPLVHGLAHEADRALDRAISWRADVLVGFPIHLLAMARLAEAAGATFEPSAVLLCSDYIPRAVVREIGRIWGCPGYSHWGTVETGLGGGVECQALDGWHPREADLLIEVLDPRDGSALPDGQWGELAMTTLTRRAMPLIRYRTGDLCRFIPGPCTCGSALRRLDKVQGRLSQRFPLGDSFLAMPLLDEALLEIPGVLDFQATLSEQEPAPVLALRLAVLPGLEDQARGGAVGALAGLPEFRPAPLSLEVTAEPWTLAGLSMAKRTLNKRRR